MLPLNLLVALIVAFGFDSPRPGVPSSDVGFRVLETCGGISLVAILSLGLGLWVASRVSHDGLPTSRVRRRYARGLLLLTVVSLLVYGWIIHSVGWSRVVRTNWGFEGLGLVNDVLVFLPFLLIQLLLWWGQYFAERALQVYVGASGPSRLGRYLLLRSRQSLGLILPVILLFVIRRDVIGRLWPSWDEGPLAEPIEIALLGSLVLIASPLFVRLAWPTRSLPRGALRDRLERVAHRAGFRFTDILVWDSGGTMLNACVTGIVPGFRYVLLTDALVETMTPVEVAAVFGHEIGHIAHRHLLYFGFFFAGSLGILSLLAESLSRGVGWAASLPWLSSWMTPQASEFAHEAAVLGLLGLYFWLVFGYLSRRFERQADVFGSKVVSCERAECSPHVDLDEVPQPSGTSGTRLPLCRSGLRTFSEALAIVAQCNGIELRRRSWRHGSIANRIGFLQRLEHDRSIEPRFQREVLWLRVFLGAVMVMAMLAATLRQAIASW
jgi:STE24 endopeptidase